MTFIKALVMSIGWGASSTLGAAVANGGYTKSSFMLGFGMFVGSLVMWLANYITTIKKDIVDD
jgi:hypothetical protein